MPVISYLIRNKQNTAIYLNHESMNQVISLLVSDGLTHVSVVNWWPMVSLTCLAVVWPSAGVMSVAEPQISSSNWLTWAYSHRDDYRISKRRKIRSFKASWRLRTHTLLLLSHSIGQNKLQGPLRFKEWGNKLHFLMREAVPHWGHCVPSTTHSLLPHALPSWIMGNSQKSWFTD